MTYNDINIETIDSETKLEKDDVKIETIYPEELVTPDYSYGNGQNTLDANIAIRNLSSNSSASLIKTGVSSVPSGYTDYAITGVGFTPKALQITVRSGNKVAWGNADNVGGTLTQRCIYADAGSYGDTNTRLFRFDGTNVGLLVSFDADGFTVKSDLAATMDWTCLG